MGNKWMVLSVLVLIGSFAQAIPFAGEMECGTYQVRGKLTFDSNDNMTLRTQGENPVELILVGKHLAKAVSWENQEVSAEVVLPAKPNPGARAFVEVKKWLAENIDSKNPLVLQKKGKCKNEVTIKWKE